MKSLVCGFAISFGLIASSASAELTLNVDGEDYTLSALMENCQALADDPVAQITCFNDVSQLVEEQTGGEPEPTVSVDEALETLRAAAQYQDEETGLFISGKECRLQILYYANYFHISRRNVSSIDLFSAAFDASQFQIDELSEVRGAQAPLYRGVMASGATGSTRGGLALESAEFGFAAKSARASIAEYAVEVVNQLTSTQGQEFDFVLVHPARASISVDIKNAFETYVKACK